MAVPMETPGMGMVAARTMEATAIIAAALRTETAAMAVAPIMGAAAIVRAVVRLVTAVSVEIAPGTRTITVARMRAARIMVAIPTVITKIVAMSVMPVAAITMAQRLIAAQVTVITAEERTAITKVAAQVTTVAAPVAIATGPGVSDQKG